MGFDRRYEERLLQAVQSAETAAIQLRQYAAAVLTPMSEVHSPVPVADLVISIEVTPEGWLSITLPAMLPRRRDGDRARFLVEPLRTAIRDYFADKFWPRFHTCVLVYEHIYDLARNRRFIDHDNLELKHCQDVLEAAFLTNDSSTLCSAFQCSHRGEGDGTRIWILTPEQFPEWLKKHRECWGGTPKI